MPDFKTIADFRRDNGDAIRSVCREFVLVCQHLRLFEQAIVAIDGSKFKAVNNRDKNFTERKLQARLQQLEQSIARYLAELDRADREISAVLPGRMEHLKAKIDKVRAQMRQLRVIGRQMRAVEDQQIPPSDPDAHSMATSGRGTGVVGHNVQTAVDVTSHLIVAYEVTNVSHDRSHLKTMSDLAKEGCGTDELIVLADRGHYDGEQILQCERAGIDSPLPLYTACRRLKGAFRAMPAQSAEDS